GYYKSCWRVINGHKYYFNSDGYALAGWQRIQDKWYFFENTAGHPLECALYVTDGSGIQAPGSF
ncbi:MAG: CHAP domain-containing protein, partial [Clostridiales bacterium]|nr:CHAP domain-containing protein [Clostridiales bacterium]